MSEPISILDDAPVDLNGDRIWEEGHLVRRRAREFAEAIVAETTRRGALTFAVYGPWGSGKTSFLKMVQGEVEKLKSDQKITFCWYEGKKYETAGNAAKTLVQRILRTLGGEDHKEAAQLYQSFVAEMLGPAVSLDWLEKGEYAGSLTPYEWVEKLGERAAGLADLDLWLKSQLAGKGPTGPGQLKMVLMVDELDRCSPEFIADVMDTVQRLGAVCGLFIVIGADREKLWPAIEARHPDSRGAQWVLEKYIQCSVDLPPLDEELLSRFLKLAFAEEAAKDPALMAIVDEAPYLVAGLRDKTPRTIKRCINAIWPVLRLELERQPGLTREEKQLIIKEQILAYQWPAFYEQYYLPAKRPLSSSSPKALFLADLELICEEYYSERAERVKDLRDRRAIFDITLKRRRERWLPDESDVDVPDELARLLAMGPFLGKAKIITPAVPDKGEILSEEIPDISSAFMSLYIQSEQADAIGDIRASVQAADQAYHLVSRNKKQLGASIAPQLGNLGVNAEKAKAMELAERLFRLALELDPNHGGVLQQFTSYIVDNRPDLYPEAEQMLSRLQTGFLASYNPWRTLSLLAELKARLGQEIDEPLVRQMVLAAQEKEADARQLGNILNGLIRAGRVQEGLEVLNITAERFPGGKSRYTLFRIVADALANRPEMESEFIAVDMYRQMLAAPEAMDPGDEADVLHNYATLLYKHDYDDEAGRLWYRAYDLRPLDASIRRAYAMYLLRAERPDLARRVAEGEPIDEEVLIPATKKLPERFSNVALPSLSRQDRDG